ncbi:alpha/beta hydrolase [Bacillaceae bacterium SIJ1]|uniref:alpha/beta hydrolase n=1 Tax=Litoribacterium kuwaitense TaxID=1398745 RepID=UPI0013EBE05F|nr:alpha/beta hydrolase [Litoribacterium kuwaitense]NGP44227.1 alpha/beta hydrolase [Litoribacterium kuwaitense]
MWIYQTDYTPKGVIVVIHGAVEHHGRYHWLKEHWLEEGYHVILGDLPGQGLSNRKRGHIDSFEEYLKEVHSWLSEAQSFLLPIFAIGHSMGGLVLVRLLQKHTIPLDGVILSSPALGLRFKPAPPLNVLAKGMNVLMPRLQMSPGLTPNIATRNKHIVDSDSNDSLMLQKVSVRWYSELVKAMELAFKEMSEFPDVPLLIMQGGNDKIVDKQLVKQWFNEYDGTEKMYKEWPGLYHEIFNEPEREQVFRFCTRFVQMHAQGFHMSVDQR